MFNKDKKADNLSKNPLTKKMNTISYDEHFTGASESIDLMKNSKYVDIGDGIAKHKESEYSKFTK